MGTKDHIVPSQGHNEEVDAEFHAVDEERGLTDHPWAGDVFAVGDSGRQPRPRLNRQPCAPCSPIPDEAVGGADVDKGDEGGGSEQHLELDGDGDGDPHDRMQGEDWGFCVRLVPVRRVIGGGDVDAVDEEDAPATRLWPRVYRSLQLKQRPCLPPMLFLFSEGQALDWWPPVPCSTRRVHLGDRGRG